MPLGLGELAMVGIILFGAWCYKTEELENQERKKREALQRSRREAQERTKAQEWETQRREAEERENRQELSLTEAQRTAFLPEPVSAPRLNIIVYHPAVDADWQPGDEVQCLYKSYSLHPDNVLEWAILEIT